jgi:antitoxin MazE
MKTKIVKIGNSRGIVLSKHMIKQYNFESEVEIQPQAEGLLIKPVTRPARADWEAQFKSAIAAGQEPDPALLEGFTNHFDEEEWNWQ